MRVPVNEPVIPKQAFKYINDCLKTGWISSAGEYIDIFEKNFAQFINVKYAVTTTSGTSALHLALVSLGIKKGDEVIIPDLTIVSCANAVLYTGAIPVVCDVDSKTGNVDPSNIEEKISKKTKAIMVVHLYGHPVDMDPILKIAHKYKLYVIEDAAQAHGAEYKGKKIGSIGDIGCFSFYGNKIVTTGEGGMVVTNKKKFFDEAKILKDLAHNPKKRFMHNEIGFNYRMTNLQAALGVAQLEKVENYITRKRQMAKIYSKRLSVIPHLELPQEANWAKSVYWMYTILVKKDSPITKEELRIRLLELGIDTREFFFPLHQQPIFKKMGIFKGAYCPNSCNLSLRGLYIPSGLALTNNQIDYVVDSFLKIFSKYAK